MTKTLIVTLELPVRAMTEEEWSEAWDGCGHDEEKDEGPGREETLHATSPSDFEDVISSALNSVNNPEILEGTGLFVHTENAVVTSIGWKAA